VHLLALEFPPVSRLVEWPPFLLKHSSLFAINKVVLLMILSTIIVIALFMTAGRRARLVPTGVQNVAESVIDFVTDGIVMETMGPEGLSWVPFLVTMFSFVFVCNIFEVIPVAQMPVNARMALPAFMAIIVWVLFNFIGIKNQGFFGYFKNMLFPPGVPKALYLLVTPIEFVSTILLRPFSLAVRLFANMLAGHLLLATFAILSAALWSSTYIGAVVPGSLLVALFGFEVLVAVLQAYIFTILTAVFIGGAMHPEH
jgi:F-type H+-transporting ATPase subunit a